MLADLNDFAVQYRYETLAVDAIPLKRVEVARHIDQLLTHVESLVGF